MNEVNFRQTMRRYPDEELARIVDAGASEGLDPIAITAARVELHSRAIDNDKLRQIMAQNAEFDARLLPHDQRPLGLVPRILFVPFALFLLFPAMIAAAMLASAGYKRKSQQAWASIAIGAIILLVFAGTVAFL